MITLLPKTKDTNVEVILDWIQHCGYPARIFYFKDVVEVIKTVFLPPTGPSVYFIRNQYDWLIEATDISNVNFSLYFERRELLRFYLEDLSRREGLKLINYVNDYNGNKLSQLKAAEKVGLKIPKTGIATDKKSLLEAFDKETELVTKSLHKGLIINESDGLIVNYTSKVEMDAVPDRFYPSLVQELIEKEYEIRSFYLDGKCFSAAILSQTDEQTEVDFRRYNLSKPNRIIPYQLPSELEQKIDLMMRDLGLVSGSIDLIKSKAGDFVFLEVNPHGHFGFVSTYCNYYLEKEIANYLIDEYQNQKKYFTTAPKEY